MSLIAIQTLPPLGLLAKLFLDGAAAADPSQIASVFAVMPAGDKKKVDMMATDVLALAKTLPGVTGPLDFFDPLGFCTDCSEGKLCFYREVELKHGRVAMLASLGFLVGESFHPLFGGDIDVPSYLAFQQTPLQTFWPAVVAAIAIPEIFSVYDFEEPASQEPMSNGRYEQWTMKTDREIGSPRGGNFDPLGLKPEDPAELLAMQNKDQGPKKQLN
jgi:light-harvesting complex I chlorophyll a/b binding protein 4